MAVLPESDPRATGTAESRLRSTKVGGQRHLEIARIARHDMDLDSTGLQQRGFIGP